MNKQSLLSELVAARLSEVKLGIIVKGVSDIDPIQIATELSSALNRHIYISAVGYDNVLSEIECAEYTISNAIEKTVLWRSNPVYAGSIVAFVKNDSDKLHSLAEFEVVSSRDLSRRLIEQQIDVEANTPTQNFWKALLDTSDYYSYDVVYEFVSAVASEENSTISIPQNMWRLNLLCDKSILGTSSSPVDRLKKNRELIFAIGQLSEDSRKKLSRSLAHTKIDDKERLQSAYTALQNLYKYGNKSTLRTLDFDTVQDLFSASKKVEPNSSQKPVETGKPVDNSDSIEPIDAEATPIKGKELGKIIADAVVNGDENAQQNVTELLDKLRDHFNPESSESESLIPPIGGIFDDRPLDIDNHNKSDLRKLVGKVCNYESWGALMETEESVLRDAISADIKKLSAFNPCSKESMISFNGGIDGPQTLFEFLSQFDVQFDRKGLDSAERFKPIINSLISLRKQLIDNLDLVMYFPVLYFGADNTAKQTLLDYIGAWSKLYHAFCINEPAMREISAGGTSFAARALLLLDVLYVKTPTEWKGIILPLHPIYLWRYYEVFKSLPSQRSSLDEDDAKALSEVLNQLPQVLSFLIANNVVTDSSDDKVLPCSGNIEMLPTFENKTNRYLGDDGTQSISEVLTRWIGFAPYTQNEVRICSVDAPDLIGILRSIKSFMDKNGCQKIVYDVYLTRKQNGNAELSKLDYSGKDYEIGEYIKNNRIVIRIKNVDSATDVKQLLNEKPVHVAFYFDQSSYAIEYGPNSKNLYINPLVVTYDYDFDEIQHKGSIFPSSDMDSGLIGDYHKLMKTADVISNNMNPRTTYNGSADMSAVVSTIEDKQTQWLVAADRDTNNYDPQKAIPIGEMQYDRRVVNVWTSTDSRIITQYLTLLRAYNLYPKTETLTGILKEFGHISSSGLISIPKFGADAQAVDNKRKGLLGTLFSAAWYTKKHRNALVASLDDSKARIWLHDSRFGNERADLVGLHFDEETNTLHIQPIEVKTRDESPDAKIEKDSESGKMNITGHAAGQIAAVVKMLEDIFNADENETDMFVSARREVLKFQIVSECFRSIHNAEWQKEWYDVLKKAFGHSEENKVNIVVSGLLMYIKLSEASGGKVIQCTNPEFDDCPIEFRQLSAKEIQDEIFGDGIEKVGDVIITDFDETEDNEDKDQDEVVVDYDKVETDSVVEQEKIKSTELNSNSSEPDEKKQDNLTDTNVVVKEEAKQGVSKEEINGLVRDFKRACGDYHISLRECDAQKAVVGPSVIRLCFKLGHGQSKQSLISHLEDIGREMKRSGVIVQDIKNSDELMLDVPRLQREKVLFKDIVSKLPKVTSPEQLYFPLGRTPNGRDVIEDLSEMPHMLVGGSTGSGKSVFLFTMLASFLITHPQKEDMQLILSSSKMEDFIHFEGLPHLYSGHIISDAAEATKVIQEVIFDESERRGKLLADARVANIIEYNKKAENKLEPIVVVIDEFADLADQLDTKKEQNAFYKPVQRIAQAGRSRGIHLVICTQRPEAKLVPSTTKAQLNGRIALRVNDGISSRMIIESPDAQYLQKHGDMIYKNGDSQERAQGYLIEIEELDQIIEEIINSNK